MITEQVKKPKPPYLIGLLGIIPLVGAFVGVALVLYGIFRYKDKWLIIIGSSAIIFTIFVYSSLFYMMTHSKVIGEGYAKIAKTELNSLVNQIEFYKFKKGAYPDSLQELRQLDSMIFIADPLLVRRLNRGEDLFQYQRIGQGYTLFSVGIDGLAHTADDIYPTISDTSGIKYGLIGR